jgi:WD40 repeat protein
MVVSKGITEMSMAESSGLSSDAIDKDNGGDDSGDFVDASEYEDPQQDESARRWAKEVAKVLEVRRAAQATAAARGGAAALAPLARTGDSGKPRSASATVESSLSSLTPSPAPSSSEGELLAPRAKVGEKSATAPSGQSAAALMMSRRSGAEGAGKGHRRGQGSLAPVLDRISGSNADSPSMRRSTRDLSQSMANGVGGAPDMTPNSRRLLSSPGEWLKQAINPNTADPTFIQSFKKHKVKREFNHVHLLQEVQGHVGAVWTAQISPDGKYFLSGGKDLKLNLYSIAMPDDGTNSILHHRCTYEGHSGDILCVSWAMNSQAFVSASMDKTVRLWKVPAKAVASHKEAAVVEESVVFEHADFVTSVAFHPNGEWFVSGCFDKKLRVWSIRDRSVLFWVDLSSFITSVALASEGGMVICGDHEGKATLFQTEGLRWVTQIHVRSRRGRNSKGKKISGIRVMPDQESFLVTSNDSRVRLFRLADFGLICKYKGIENDNFQIVANPSESGEHIICGSEANNVVVWNTHKRNEGLSFSLSRQKFAERKDRNRSYEFWRCSDAAVTVAMFLPAASRAAVIPQGMGDQGIGEGTPDTTLMITCDETGKISCFENRKRFRKHMAVARSYMRGSSRSMTAMMPHKSPNLYPRPMASEEVNPSRTSSASAAPPPPAAAAAAEDPKRAAPEVRAAPRVPSNPAVERFKNGRNNNGAGMGGGGGLGGGGGGGNGPGSRPNSRPNSLSLKKEVLQMEEDSSDDSL